MFGRQIFLESVDDRSEQWRRNECLRQLLAARVQQGMPFAQLTRIPFSRNDGFTFDLNFIVLDDPYLRTPRISTTDQYLLEYIRQMEERYAAMERELTRTKMLLPLIPCNTVPPRQATDWKECSLAKKYECNGASSSGGHRETAFGSQDALNREKIHASSRRRHHARRVRDSTVDCANWRNCRNTFQNSQNDVYPIRDPGSHSCRPKILNNDSTAVCSTHNVAVILPEGSSPSANDARHDRTLPRPEVRQFFPNGNTGMCLHANNITLESGSKRDATNMADICGKFLIDANTQKPQPPMKNALMEACQRSDEKREPETSRCIDSDVKHEDYKQTGFMADGSILPSTMESKLHRDDSARNPESIVRESSADLAEKRAIKRIKCFENAFARREENRLRKLQQERTGLTNDQARHLTRMLQKNVRTQKRVPTPRSNVHTACTPMVQPALSNPVLDPNGMTVRLLRLAVLLYAPTLLPTLNSLIAQQNSQSAIPIPCFEGSNDLLTQLLRVLSSQQRVPNLSYTASPRPEETPQNSSVASSSSPCSLSNPEQRFQRRAEGTRWIMQLPRKMSTQNLNPEKLDPETGSREHKASNEIRFAGDERKDKLYEPKHKQKLVRVLTVVAYVIFVSMGAILLSLYYTFVWDPKDVTTARNRPRPVCDDTKLPNPLTTPTDLNETQLEKVTVRSVSDESKRTEEPTVVTTATSTASESNNLFTILTTATTSSSASTELTTRDFTTNLNTESREGLTTNTSPGND